MVKLITIHNIQNRKVKKSFYMHVSQLVVGIEELIVTMLLNLESSTSILIHPIIKLCALN